MVCIGVMQVENPSIKIGEWQISTAVQFLDLNIELQLMSQDVPTQSRVSTHIYRKPCDLRVILHMQSSHDYSVKFGTLLSQMIRIWRLCTNQEAACREISEFLLCMRMFRGLQPCTIRKVTNRFIGWLCTYVISRYPDSCINRTKFASRRTKRTLCKLPRELNRECVNSVLRNVFERLSHVEQACVGQIRIANLTARRLYDELS